VIPTSLFRCFTLFSFLFSQIAPKSILSITWDLLDRTEKGYWMYPYWWDIVRQKKVRYSQLDPGKYIPSVQLKRLQALLEITSKATSNWVLDYQQWIMDTERIVARGGLKLLTGWITKMQSQLVPAIWLEKTGHKFAVTDLNVLEDALNWWVFEVE
jgi:hypothetical protein